MVAKADGGSGSPWIATDYSCYSLDDIWTSVNQNDTQTWSQIDAWNTMASICGEQAGQLKLALAQLMQRWVPISGSAAEAFAATVNKLIAAMHRDASAATGMPPVLTQIVSAMSDTKDKLQNVIDQRDHYQAVEQAHQANPIAMRFAPASLSLPAMMGESVPDNWRQDLRAQAVDIMHASDANLGAITAQMPELSEAINLFGEEFTSVLPPQPVAQGGSGGNSGGALSARMVTPNAHTPVIGIPPADGSAIGSSSFTTTLAGLPTLAGLSQSVSPTTPGPAGNVPPPGWTGVPAGAVITPSRAVVPLTQHGQVLGQPTTGESATGSPAADEVGPSRAASAGGPLIGSPGGVAPRSQASRPSVRPAGRAALWASQRNRGRGNDRGPWSVPSGVPTVIEPGEPAEHDPGPGVIGIDR